MSREKIISIALIIAILSITLYFYWLGAKTDEVPAGYGDVTVSQAITLMNVSPDLLVLDVRTKEEYGEGHLKDAVLIPLDELEKRIGELFLDNELLVYCRTGNRSSQAINILKANGYTKLYHLKDGISGWTLAGGQVVK